MPPNPQERRHPMASDFLHNERRNMGNLSDRRHISPPLHLNLCEGSPNLINGNQNDVLLQRNPMEFNQRRHGRGNESFFIFMIFCFNSFVSRI